MKHLLKCLLILYSFNLNAYDFEVSVATVFQNEAPFLKEWIEFHKLVGIEHFYLYNNNSEDDFEKVLKPYIEEGLVELIDWPERPQTRDDWHLIQRKALRDAILRSRNVSKWVAFIDADEFIFPSKQKTVIEFLKGYEKYAAVTANWQVFGTSNIEQLNKNKLMVEQLTLKAKSKKVCNAFVKSIVQVKYIDTEKLITNWKGVHTFPLIEGAITVNANKKQVTDRFKDFTFPIDKIRIHHYKFRDEYFFKHVKLQRADANDEKTGFLLKCAEKANRVKDKSILIHAKALRLAVFG